ncbi:hypothetical protein QBC35DRAFT_546156 [Podospora australis]|uniref:Protein kinase domain-containing protein n=1 Tax=Podospora australis TaxID=1536484 RepID=A0AAN6WX91_9PEZI|nr:hypothetical protein QBC35DRAFT_546156 [Podospora australis]
MVLLTQASNAIARDLTNSSYVLYKTLGNGRFLVRRKEDGAIFIGHPFASYYQISSPVTALVDRGAGHAAANVLNHENLVSIHAELLSFLPRDTAQRKIKARVPTRLLLQDYCDLGNLRTLLDEPPVSPNRNYFLPESLCWHVTICLLRALQWLHEGKRDHRLVTADPANPKRCLRVREVTQPEPDWLPIFHRNIRPENVGFTSPRGIETYGQVKLRDLSSCSVVNGVGELDKDRPSVASDRPLDIPAGELRQRYLKYVQSNAGFAEEDWQWWHVPRAERVYSIGDELAAVGDILFTMMRHNPTPPLEECTVLCGGVCRHVYSSEMETDHPACTHGCFQDVDVDTEFNFTGKGYSQALKDIAVALIKQVRNLKSEPASYFLTKALDGYEFWVKTSEDGIFYRDEYDDAWFRRQNVVRLQTLIGSELNTRGSHVPANLLAGDIELSYPVWDDSILHPREHQPANTASGPPVRLPSPFFGIHTEVADDKLVDPFTPNDFRQTARTPTPSGSESLSESPSPPPTPKPSSPKPGGGGGGVGAGPTPHTTPIRPLVVDQIVVTPVPVIVTVPPTPDPTSSITPVAGGGQTPGGINATAIPINLPVSTTRPPGVGGG